MIEPGENAEVDEVLELLSADTFDLLPLERPEVAELFVGRWQRGGS